MADLLLLTVDSLRADRFSQDHFPRCWRMFDADFAHFENAMANGIATPLSFPSIHTGCPPPDDGTLPLELPTIAELYANYTWAVSNNPHLRPDRGYDRGFEFFTDSIEENDDRIPKRSAIGNVASAIDISEMLRIAYDRVARAIPGGDNSPDLTPPPNSAAHVINGLRAGMDSHHGFFWAHFNDPHYQFKPQKVLDRDVTVNYTNSEILSINERFVESTPDSSDIEFLISMYEEQIAYLDRQLADFFNHLKTEDRWDDTMIVFMADHGEAFGEQGVYNHQWSADPIDPLVRVPLLVKFSGGSHAGETYEHLVQNADLLATLIMKFGWNMDYPPNTQPLTDTGSRTIVSKSTTAIRVTTDAGYAIRRRDGSTDMKGAIEDDAMEVLDASTIPAVEKLSGNVPGLGKQEQKDVEKRLEQLGYE